PGIGAVAGQMREASMSRPDGSFSSPTRHRVDAESKRRQRTALAALLVKEPSPNAAQGRNVLTAAGGG
ncbi:MAG: hypothetical protein WA618_10625, partial [Terriglobales bacterium]